MSCPVCLSTGTTPALTGTDTFFEMTRQTFTLNSCSSCRCLFLNPMPGNEEIASFYPQDYWWNASRGGFLRRLEGIYRRIALRDHISFIRRAAGRGAVHLLDVGCGSGTLIGILKEYGFRVRGVDYSAEAAQVAREENGVDVAVGSIHDASFPPGSFDLVTLFHVLEHVTNPREVLAEVFRIVKPSGAVVLQVPNIDSWQFKMFGAKWYGLDIPRHVIDYSKAAMMQLLEASGFKVYRVRDFNLRDNAPALVSSLFPSLDPISRAVRQRQRGQKEATLPAWFRHLAYLVLVLCAYPLALAESAFGHGATVMIEARKP